MAHRSQSFAYGTKNEASNHSKPIVYSALLSRIAIELRQRITLSDHIKDDIEYKNTFDGKEVVVRIYIYISPCYLYVYLLIHIGG